MGSNVAGVTIWNQIVVVNTGERKTKMKSPKATRRSTHSRPLDNGQKLLPQTSQ